MITQICFLVVCNSPQTRPSRPTKPTPPKVQKFEYRWPPRYPVWATETTWIKENDAKYKDVRTACEAARIQCPNYNLSLDFPERARKAVEDWRKDKTSPFKLYRASYLLSTARHFDYRYEYSFSESRTVGDLVRCWMKTASQKSYEFSRYGFIFVSSFAPYELYTTDLMKRLFVKNPIDDSLKSVFIQISYSTSKSREDSRRGIKYAEELFKKYPKRVSVVLSCILAYNDAWLDDIKQVSYLDKVVEFINQRQAMLPDGHPLKGKEQESIREAERLKREHGS